MATRKGSGLRWIAVAVIAATAGYWYASPYLALKQMRAAAERHDAETFNDYVDYPRLRQSLKGQMAAALTEKATRASNDSERAAAALGAGLANAFGGALVDAMVRPEVVIRLMTQAKPGSSSSAGVVRSPSSKDDVNWTVQRLGMNKMVVYGTDKEDAATPDDQKAGAVFERTGFANWKLTELRLPSSGM